MSVLKSPKDLSVSVLEDMGDYDIGLRDNLLSRGLERVEEMDPSTWF